jgi:hypothetical protein
MFVAPKFSNSSSDSNGPEPPRAARLSASAFDVSAFLADEDVPEGGLMTGGAQPVILPGLAPSDFAALPGFGALPSFGPLPASGAGSDSPERHAGAGSVGCL